MSGINEWDYRVLVDPDFKPGLEFLRKTKKLLPDWQKLVDNINRYADVTLSLSELIPFLNKLGDIGATRNPVFNGVGGIIIGRQGLKRTLSIYEKYEPDIACVRVRWDQIGTDPLDGRVEFYVNFFKSQVRRCNRITLSGRGYTNRVHFYVRPDGLVLKKPQEIDRLED